MSGPFRPLGTQLGLRAAAAPQERRERWTCRGLLRDRTVPQHLAYVQGLCQPLLFPRMATVSSALGRLNERGQDEALAGLKQPKPIQRPKKGRGEYDVVLSSGFLAFALHSGFLQAVEDAKLSVKAVMGTSAGALTGSLYAAGYTPTEVAALLSKDPPYKLLRPCWPWQGGLLSMQPVVDRLSELLPATFEELPTEFACGVVSRDGRHRVINSGPLPQAVVASAAIPVLFAPVHIPGQDNGPFKDGGKVDRIGLKQWRDFRRKTGAKGDKVPPALVHLIGRSSPFSGNDTLQTGERDVTMVKSPKSGVSLLSLGNFPVHLQAAQQRTAKALAIMCKRGQAARV